MKLIGYCVECSRFRLVRIVREWGYLAPAGICDECEGVIEERNSRTTEATGSATA